MTERSASTDVQGLLFIGDPHLEARIPGFRKDDYPQVALKKFRWCLRYARKNQLQPILLGDLFQLPQDNPNWLLSAIIESIDEPLPAIYGNHDVRENSLKPHDSIHILFAGGHLNQISAESPWIGTVGGRQTVVGGTAWGDRIPKEFVDDSVAADLVVWITHHDILIPGYEESGRVRPSELSGIDLIVNGHIHRRLQPVSKGGTHWVTAGNITRRARSDASREHIPAVPCLLPADGRSADGRSADDGSEPFAFQSRGGDSWQIRWVTVPHEPFDAVFHPEVESEQPDEEHGSGFIADLRQLTARRTDSGAGLHEFLKQHLDQFDAPVADEIMRLAAEVTSEQPDNHNRDS